MSLSSPSGTLLDQGSSRHLKVLIVEDDAMIASLLADMLMDIGHQVCAIVSTETGAIAAASCHRPDLMIVDAGLGQGSGMHAVDKILESRFVPHVFVSGSDLRSHTLHHRAVTVRKPFFEPDLLRAIDRALTP